MEPKAATTSPSVEGSGPKYVPNKEELCQILMRILELETISPCNWHQQQEKGKRMQKNKKKNENVTTKEDKDNPLTAICQNINKINKVLTDLTDSEDEEEAEVSKTLCLKGGADNNPQHYRTNQGRYI